ncbi:hypothetical protein DFJ73DRAFT_957802 [Zopfochytrium polystomum]|nr:hypothetical protein DFJ73DRAFT_957802 [Zopfochytrium polystomum]
MAVQLERLRQRAAPATSQHSDAAADDYDDSDDYADDEDFDSSAAAAADEEDALLEDDDGFDDASDIVDDADAAAPDDDQLLFDADDLADLEDALHGPGLVASLGRDYISGSSSRSSHGRKLSAKAQRALAAYVVRLANSTSAGQCYSCLTNGCKNFGSCSGPTCTCPPGFGGPDCSQPTCNSTTVSWYLRTVRSQDESCTCDSGFTGPTCNVCKTKTACTAVLGSDAECNSSPEPWQTNHGVCDISDTRLSSKFPGRMQLTISRDRAQSSALASVWLDNHNQLSCDMRGCAQLVTGPLQRWECASMVCECAGNTTLCPLVTASASLSNGSFLFICSGSDSTCTAKFPFFDRIAPTGVTVANCTYGECARPTDRPFFEQQAAAPALSVVEITSIAIAAVLFLALTACFLWAVVYKLCVVQRRKPPKKMEGPNIMIHRLSYQIKGVGEILKEVSAVVPAGRVMAIMGPSGSGKSSLLSILAQEQKEGRTRGAILFNGTRLLPHVVKSIVGFVRQGDYFLPTLTVRETLLWYATLRCSEKLFSDEIRQRVDQIIEDIGLSVLKDVRVGLDGVETPQGHGLSVGERRLLSIAMEIVRDCPILLLDEPTTGLDSSTSYHLIKYLVHLSRSASKTIILTIHQPRSDIYTLFDEVIVLSSGSQLYSGPGSSASSHFKSRGYPCPEGHNVADHMLDLAMGINTFDYAGQPVWKGDNVSVASIKRRRAETLGLQGGDGAGRSKKSASRSSLRADYLRAAASGPPTELEASRPLTGGEAAGEPSTPAPPPLQRSGSRGSQLARMGPPALRIRLPGDSAAAGAPSATHHFSRLPDFPPGWDGPPSHGAGGGRAFSDDDPEMAWDEAKGGPFGAAGGGLSFREAESTGFLSQMMALGERKKKETLRDPALIIGHAVISVVFGVFVAIFYVGTDLTLSSLQGRLGSFTFVLAFVGFSSLTAAGSITSHLSLQARERASGYYSSFPAYFINVTYDLLYIRLLPVVAVTILTLLLVGSTSGPIHFVKHFAVLVVFSALTSLLAMAIGLAVGAGSSSAGAGGSNGRLAVATLVIATVVLWMLLFSGFVITEDVIPTHLRWMKYLSFFYYAFEAMIVNDLTDDAMMNSVLGSSFSLTPAHTPHTNSTQLADSQQLNRFGFGINNYSRDMIVSCGLLLVMLVVVFALFHVRLARGR